MTLVERVAEAIAKADPNVMYPMSAARAAIEAMRTHFDQMSTASNEADVARGYVDDWLAAALEEKH